MRVNLVILCGALALAVSGGAAAQDRGFYGGIGLGKSKARLHVSDFSLDDPRVEETRDVTNTGYKFFGGYRLNRYLATELSYTDFGKFAYIYNASSLGLGQSKVTYQATSWAWSGVVTIPFGATGFSTVGRVGASINKAERSGLSGDFTTVPGIPAAQKSRLGLLVGLGGQYDFTPSLAMRLELEHYGNFGEAQDDAFQHTGRASVHMLSLNFIARF